MYRIELTPAELAAFRALLTRAQEATPVLSARLLDPAKQVRWLPADGQDD